MKFSGVLGLALPLLLLTLFFCPRPLFSESSLNTGANENKIVKEAQVFSDTVAGFELFTTLIEEVQYRRDSVYPMALKAATREQAVAWLEQGFTDDLAISLANYYLAWDEKLNRLVVIPEDSIPVLTEGDRAATTVTFRNDRHARLECMLYECYAPGDCYRYIIETENSGEGWKITELTAEFLLFLLQNCRLHNVRVQQYLLP